MKIREYGEIHFDGHQVIIGGWRFEMKGKKLPMRNVFVDICKEISKNPNVTWLIEENEFLP